MNLGTLLIYVKSVILIQTISIKSIIDTVLIAVYSMKHSIKGGQLRRFHHPATNGHVIIGHVIIGHVIIGHVIIGATPGLIPSESESEPVE